MPKTITWYECTNCSKRHNIESEAEECEESHAMADDLSVIEVNHIPAPAMDEFPKTIYVRSSRTEKCAYYELV